MSLERVPPSSAEDDRQHVLELFGTDNESRWFFREDGLAFIGGCDNAIFSGSGNRLVIPGFATRTVYRCAVAFTRENFVIAVDSQLSSLFA